MKGDRKDKMNKNTIITMLVILVGLMSAAIIVKEIIEPPPIIEPPTPPSIKSNALPTSVERELPKIKSSDIGRVASEADEPQTMTSIFEATGKGKYAKWGAAADADLYYMLKLVATSKVESKEQFESGKVKIVEVRTFQEAKEVIKPAKVNFQVDLSTLPLNQIETTGYLLGGLISIFEPCTGVEIGTAVAGLREQIDALDGQEGRPIMDFLNRFGIDLDKIVNEPVERYLNGLLKEVHSHVNTVQGKSYRFIYWTDKEGEPLRVRYENVDHSPISVEEQNILNYVNLFIDCHVLPDKGCRPGASWNIDPAAVASMFGVLTGGKCAGDVKVIRGNDLPDGNWDLTISPATVTLYSDDKRPIGNVKINGGKAIGDAHKAVLRELQIDGKGKLRRHDKETKWWFYDFGIKIEGDCEFRTSLFPQKEE